ncbi:MAG: hypothetical protein J7J93_01045 [Candidatus Aenigmarchaeota archaeon]|nr:hypothetical protein [Candidatus Aenigmarchaeota archaeon]
MARTRCDQIKSWKVVLFWILGAGLLLAAALIAGNTQIDFSTSITNFGFSLMVAFVLILIAGLLWVSVAVAIKELEER